MANTTLLDRSGSVVNYSDIGVALLGHALSLKANKSFEQLVGEKILNVLGMDSTGITVTNEIASRLAKGRLVGKEMSLEFLPEVIQPAGALHSSTKDLLKYLSANMDLIHTKLDSPMQETHLIRQTFSVSPSSNQTLAPITYVGLGWFTTILPNIS